MGGGLERLEGEIAFLLENSLKKMTYNYTFKTCKSYKGLKGRSLLSSLGFE